jgi:hypothetical protein
MHAILPTRPLVLLFVLVLALAGCGGGGADTKGKGARGPLTVDRALSRAPDLKTTNVRGQGFPVSDTAFVLDGKKQSIFVLGEASAVRAIDQPGKKVVVTGAMRRLDEQQAKQLTSAAEDVGAGDEKGGRKKEEKLKQAVQRARRGAGAFYLALERVMPAEEGNEGKDKKKDKAKDSKAKKR